MTLLHIPSSRLHSQMSEHGSNLRLKAVLKKNMKLNEKKTQANKKVEKDIYCF